MRALLLILSLLSSFTFAQVANPCGAGKACTVSTLMTTRTKTIPGSSLSAVQLNADSSIDWVQGGASIANVGTYVGGLYFNNSGNDFYFTGASVQANSNVYAGGFNAPLAFASFPSCAGARFGQQRYDSTNDVWRFCSSVTSTWVPMGSPGISLAGFAFGASPVNNFTLLGVQRAVVASKARSISCFWNGGSGGTTGVSMSLRLRSSTFLTPVCSCTLGACNAGATGGTCTCSASIPAGDDVALAYVTTAAGSGGLSDCATNPTEFRCNVN